MEQKEELDAENVQQPPQLLSISTKTVLRKEFPKGKWRHEKCKENGFLKLSQKMSIKLVFCKELKCFYVIFIS